VGDKYIIIFFISLLLSLFLTPLVRKFCIRVGLTDSDRERRKIHKGPMPRLGGIAFFLAFIITSLLTILYSYYYTNQLTGEINTYFLILAISAGAFCIGLIDDIFKLRARFKFLLQIILAVIVYVIGFRITKISFPLLTNALNLGILSLPVTVVWYVAITNAFNLIDGVDGLAAGLAVIAAVVMAILAMITGHVLEACVLIILAASLLGFLRYNFNPASIFMGDAGSMFIGFTLALLSVTSSLKASAALVIFIPFLVLAIPLLDTTVAFFRRFLINRNVFKPDREHIHHKLLDKGLSQKKVAFILYGAAAVLGLYSLLIVNVYSRYIGYAFIIIFLAILYSVHRIGYNEFVELFRYIVLGWPTQSKKIAKQIQMRKALDISQFKNGEVTPESVFNTLKELLDDFGFDKVELVVTQRGIDEVGSFDDFKWQRRNYGKSRNCSLITLPIDFENNGSAFLTLSKFSLDERVNVRFSLIFEELPEYLRKIFNEVYVNGKNE